MASMFAQYKMEREGKSVLENEHGFAVFYFKDNMCVVDDIFILKTHRDKDHAKELLETIKGLAREKECKLLIGSVSPNAIGCHRSLEMCLHYGFKLLSSTNDLIYLSMEL